MDECFSLFRCSVLGIPQKSFSQTEGKLWQGWDCVCLVHYPLLSLLSWNSHRCTAQTPLLVLLAGSPLLSALFREALLQRAALSKVIAFLGWVHPVSDWYGPVWTSTGWPSQLCALVEVVRTGIGLHVPPLLSTLPCILLHPSTGVPLKTSLDFP